MADAAPTRHFVQSFAGFPKSEVYISTGSVPPPLPADPPPGSVRSDALIDGYRLLAQGPQSYPGGTNRVVSQNEFPISTTMTGALLRIRAGGLREPHWHSNADEWQYYVSGRARMSVFGLHGSVRTEEFAAGDDGLCAARPMPHLAGMMDQVARDMFVAQTCPARKIRWRDGIDGCSGGFRQGGLGRRRAL
jgi:hypothetical protein